MENFRAISIKRVDGMIKFQDMLMPRSLVLVSDKGAKAYNVAAKCRNSDAKSLLKCLVKAWLTSVVETNKENNKEAATNAKLYVDNVMKAAMRMKRIVLTDKDGHIIEGAGLVTEGDQTLGKVLKFTEEQPLYKLVVLQQKPWDDEKVVQEMNWYIQAAEEHLGYMRRLDDALGKVADGNDKEQKEAERKAKEAKAAKEAERKAKAEAKTAKAA